ncbi:hypothetical protein K469DRAFT_685470 [Zopfia rhizophila CBS 207.26]|uniref:C2H2-type domain-containing protein n=1 Tax=Zopfia rhizophila CBS 207.26 TaxID=1314779 RepID=A0A6A6EAJ7_9PEZI|nr:hypothetical protein K469DRAFT_685470 [Zopfia rhizophila CBS 207.26]
MDSAQRTTRASQRAREEASEDVSTISELDPRDFDDVTLAREDPHHQVGIPQKRRRRAREADELWNFTLDKPPEGKSQRGNSNQEIFYCKRCKKGLASATAFRLHLRTTHDLHIISNKKPKVEEESNRLAASFNVQQQRAESTAEALKARVLRDSVN